MRFTPIVAGAAFVAAVSAATMSSQSGAIQITDNNIRVQADECMDGYWDCITNCPMIMPSCATWGLNCAIIYC